MFMRSLNKLEEFQLKLIKLIVMLKNGMILCV